MLFGLNDNGKRVVPKPGQRSMCSTCGGELIAKCGEVNVWHWAHKTTEECDSWSEPITEWHLRWQTRVPIEQCEVTLGPHRADIVSRAGYIWEIQHSPISASEIHKRESFYDRIIWILDVRDVVGSHLPTLSYDELVEYTADDLTDISHEYSEWYDAYGQVQSSFRTSYEDYGGGFFTFKKSWDYKGQRNFSVWWKNKRVDSLAFSLTKSRRVLLDFGSTDALLELDEVYESRRAMIRVHPIRMDKVVTAMNSTTPKGAVWPHADGDVVKWRLSEGAGYRGSEQEAGL